MNLIKNELVEKDIQAPDDQLVCPCFELNLGHVRSMLSQNQSMSFDSFMEESKAGTRCTSCLLDLEYYFVHLPRTSETKTIVKKSLRSKQIPFRRKIYQWIDKLSPRHPIHLKNHVPIIAGLGIEQWIWIANYEMLYTKNNLVPDFDIILKIYDADGILVHENCVPLPLGKEWRVEVSQYLPKPVNGVGPDLSIGWVEITRLAKSDGVRGTTRPQIEILAPKSACAVHGQAARYDKGNSFVTISNPDYDRVFVTLINSENKPVSITMQYPSDPLGVLKISKRSISLNLPPKGALLHEVILTDEEKKAFSSRLLKFAWQGIGFYKAHVIVASISLDRFSIDHA